MILSKSFYVGTAPGIDLIHLGHDIRGFVREARFEDGIVTVACPNPGAFLALLPYEGREGSELRAAIRKDLTSLSPAIIALLPAVMSLPVIQGKFAFEPWRDIYVIDFDTGGKRRELKAQLFGPDKEERKG